MARKKASKKKTAVARVSGGSNLPVSYRDRLAALADQESDRAMSIGKSQTIRLAKGKFHFQGEALGETLPLICVDFVKVRNYFDTPYDEDNPNNPVCFALSPDGKGMVPHDTSPQKQSDTCRSCWADEFESDARQRGKACREQYLCATIHPDSLEKEALDLEDVGYLRVPPTSLAAWDSFMVKRNKIHRLPALAFEIEVSFDPDVDYQKLEFSETGRVEDEDDIEKLLALRELVHPVLMTPPDVSEREPRKKKSKKKTAKKSKKRSKKTAARGRRR